jgi:hypothetical protein
MGRYYVQKLLFNLYNDLELRKSYGSDPKEVLKGYDLTEPEIKALLDHDVGSLYRMGAHTFLLWQFGRMIGVKPEVYFKQIRGG